LLIVHTVDCQLTEVPGLFSVQLYSTQTMQNTGVNEIVEL